jgi:hypothetical protein
MHDGTNPYDGVLEVVKKLKEEGKDVIILSNSLMLPTFHKSSRRVKLPIIYFLEVALNLAQWHPNLGMSSNQRLTIRRNVMFSVLEVGMAMKNT